MKDNDYPWCVCETDELNKNKVIFECKRCKEKHIFDNSDMAISRFLEISEAFCMLHKDCKR